MAQAGIVKNEHDEVVVTVIFAAGELDGYLEQTEAAGGGAAPIDTGEHVAPPPEPDAPAGDGNGEPSS